VIVRLLLAEGSPIPLSSLPDHLQAALTEQIGQMRLIDRATLHAVVEEFVAELEGAGLAFPGGIEGALSLLDGHISASAASRLRRLAGASGKVDPWERITRLDTDRLLKLLEAESVEVGAVMLSKLAVPRAAELLGRLPGAKARRVAYAVSLTGGIDPETVRRIGLALLAQIDSEPPRAFDTTPVHRVGAILNVAPSDTRDEVLTGLDEADADFAEQVRKAIFTFAHLPDRLDPRDVPKIVRALPQPQLVAALASSLAKVDSRDAAAAEFLLSSMSQRMAAVLREEIRELGPVKDKDGEAARNAVVMAVRELETAGEIALIEPGE
jgi:flagellar motor switch protein FliG